MIGFTSTKNQSDPGKLWKLLEQERFIDKDQFKELSRKARSENKYLSEVLLEREALPQEKLLTILSEALGVPEVRLRGRVISLKVLNLIPKEIAEQHSVIIFKKIKDVIHVATTAPENQQTIEFIQRKTGLAVEVFITTAEDIKWALRKYDVELSEEFAQIIAASMKEALEVNDTAEKMANFVPIIRMVNAIIDRAITQRASDIHIEPTSGYLAVPFRIDGLLHTVVR